MSALKTYLGDGCYVAFDGYGLELTTSNGVNVTNKITLEPEVYRQLTLFVERMRVTAELTLKAKRAAVGK